MTKLDPLGRNTQGFPGGSVVKKPPSKAGDTGSIPDPGRSHRHSYWACALEQGGTTAEPKQLRRLLHPRPCAPPRETSTMRGPRTTARVLSALCNSRKRLCSSREPARSKIIKFYKYIKGTHMPRAPGHWYSLFISFAKRTQGLQHYSLVLQSDCISG